MGAGGLRGEWKSTTGRLDGEGEEVIVVSW